MQPFQNNVIVHLQFFYVIFDILLKINYIEIFYILATLLSIIIFKNVSYISDKIVSYFSIITSCPSLCLYIFIYSRASIVLMNSDQVLMEVFREYRLK